MALTMVLQNVSMRNNSLLFLGHLIHYFLSLKWVEIRARSWKLPEMFFKLLTGNYQKCPAQKEILGLLILGQ